jgi:hypothetical protein
MKPIRYLLLAALLAPLAATAGEDEAFSHALTLVQIFVQAAARSENPLASGEASRALAGLMQEATADLSPDQKDKVTAIGRDLAAMARQQAAPLAGLGADPALQARKDLTAMGLRYYDEGQFRDAVKRGDKLAVDLFVAGKGIDPALIAKNLPATR